MKSCLLRLSLATLVLAVPSRGFALWDVEDVSRKRATEFGMTVRTEATGGTHHRVALEFRVADELKDFDVVELRLARGPNSVLSVPLAVDRSKPGLAVVRLTADHARLDRITLHVKVPFTDGGAGGTDYRLRMREFVRPGED